VELLRFEWLIDANGDGEYDTVSRAPSVADWTNMVGVKIWLVTRATTEEPGFTDDFTYTIAGDSWTVPSGNEGYRRRVQSRTVDLPNIGGRRR
jgi:type IV pilus assembly protein PilW